MKRIFFYAFLVGFINCSFEFNVVAQIDKFYESSKYQHFPAGSQFGEITCKWSMILNKDSTFVIYMSGSEGNSTLTFFRDYFSTGVYKKSGNHLILIDTINDYVCKFIKYKKSGYKSIKGPSSFKGFIWNDVTYVNRGMQLHDYENKLYTLHYEKRGNDIAKLNQKVLTAKFVDKKILSGIYYLINQGDGFNLLLYDNSDFYITYQGILISSGTWSYSLGRIDLYDPFFMHTYYCHVQSDSTLSYINFPIIHSGIYDEVVLVKLKPVSSFHKALWEYYDKSKVR